MNYYPHHIGDYLRDTAHLTATEDGIYRRLLDLYYASEKPLPLDLDWLCRLIRLKPTGLGLGSENQQERESLEIILREFFEKRESGWHNKRADEEIRKARRRIKAAKTNGKNGGRKKTQQEPSGLPSGLPVGSQKKAHQKPIPNIYSAPEFEEFWAIFPRRAGGNPKGKALKAFRARIAEGATAAEVVDGARRYAAYIRATGKEGTEYVKQAASFLGPDKHFSEPWTPPEQTNISPLYRREGVM